MLSTTFFMFAMLLMIAFFVSIPVGIAFFAYRSRQSKRDEIMKTLPEGVSYTVAVRLNTPKQNAAVMKFKAFEFSGVLYIKDTKVYIKGTKEQYYEFDLATAFVTWPGVQAQNGAVQYFCMEDASQKIYVNSESGVFVFRLSSKMPNTGDVYKYLLAQKAKLTAQG